MSKDVLNEATRALRETDEVSEFEPRATRARIMTGLHQTRVRHRTRLAFLLPLAASFVAVSAWGAASGKARLLLDRFEQLVGVTAPATKPPNAAKTMGRGPVPTPPLAAPSAQPAVLTVDSDPQPLPPAPIAARAAAPARTAARAAQLRAEPIEPALALYRVAHTAHFVERDPARALAAWDAYLNAAPSAEFAPEARYNRALSLVRLGRTQEARRALEPFAGGAYGSYRRLEATALLNRIAP